MFRVNHEQPCQGSRQSIEYSSYSNQPSRFVHSQSSTHELSQPKLYSVLCSVPWNYMKWRWKLESFLSVKIIEISYLNMPIWLTMWSQFPGVLSSSVSNRKSSFLILIILSAIVLISPFHCSNSRSSFIINAIYRHICNFKKKWEKTGLVKITNKNVKRRDIILTIRAP